MKAGLYVHVPFCRHRCHFCAFLVTTHRDFLERWERAVVQEIETRAGGFAMPFDTVYFGGGTPSLAPPASIGRILVAAARCLDLTDGAEVTIEANPDDLDHEYLRRLRLLGVNRLSLGLQSLRDEDLGFLTRTHTAADGYAAFRAARAVGFENITVDILYGLPDRSRKEWRAVLEETAELGPDHVSAYQLTYEAGTPFKRYRDTGRIVALPEEEERERFLLTREWLEELGYAQYEVSSFARAREYESRHNKKYWEGAPYLGVGPAAHGYLPPQRRWNVGAVRTYVARVEAGEDPVAETETVGPEEQWLERLFLGLRTARGVAVTNLDADALESPVLARIIAENLAVMEKDRLRLTPEGLALADGIAVELAATRRSR